MVIDAEVVSREERPATSATPPASASRWAAAVEESPAAPRSAPARSKRKARKPKAKAQSLRAGDLKVRLPPPPAVRGLVCPVCLAPAEADRRVELGPVHAYLCDRCGGFASGAMQVVDFLKRFK